MKRLSFPKRMIIFIETFILMLNVRPLFLLLLVAFFFSYTSAQIANDDCANAKRLGFVPYGYNPTCFDGTVNLDTMIVDSNVNALVNLPYPQIPMNCLGYAPNIAAPANDAWFYLDPVAYVQLEGIRITSSDSLHLSVWVGDSCANLLPMRCYTVLPNIILDDPSLWITAFNRIYFQASGNAVNRFLHFSFCLGRNNAPIYYSLTPDPTPVLCFAYHLSMQEASSAVATDGSATAHVTLGTPPFTYLWSDNSTDSTIHNVAPGMYFVTITDAYGCTESDSVLVDYLTVGFQGAHPNRKCNVWQDPTTENLHFRQADPTALGNFSLWDLTGKRIAPPLTTVAGAASIGTSQLAPGTYIWVWEEGGLQKSSGKVVVFKR
jgi:hypothetical protein